MTNRNPNISINIVPILILVSITVVCLIPFADKAFNIDEPLFIWTAKHIQLHPLDFYGFRVNWYGTAMDASAIIKNPPLASYYIALAAYFTGWNEIPLHLAFLLPAIAVAVGTYFLAREFTQYPLTATLIGILNPVFLLSGSMVMCDTMMLAFFVWATLLWVYGIKYGRTWHLLSASFLIALCCLTKYFGICLFPLLLVFTLASGKNNVRRILFFMIPIAILSLYQWDTYILYGRALLSDAAQYASREKGLNLAEFLPNLVTGLSFTGGCLLPVLFFLPWLRGKWILCASAVSILLASIGMNHLHFSHVAVNATWGYYLQLSIFTVAGLFLLLLAGLDLKRRVTPESLLLALWFTGTFMFAAVVNWSVNGRSILPMAPVAGIIVMRFLENTRGEMWQPSIKNMGIPLCCAWAISMVVTWADFRLAETARSAAIAITRMYGGGPGSLWYQGHWGFQYYMDKNGGTSYDVKLSSVHAGDKMVVPENNTNESPEIIEKGAPLHVMEYTATRFLTTMNYDAGAGYYSSSFGPLPYLIDRVPAERYHVLEFPHMQEKN